MGYLYRQITTARSRLFSFAATLIAVLGLVAFGIVPASAAQAAGPSSRPVGFAPIIPAKTHLLGETPGSQALHFDIVLSPRDPAGLHSLALAVSTPGSPDRGRFLTVPQFASRFGRTRASLLAARAALRGIGLAPGPATSNGLIIPVFTTVKQAAARLHTRFVNYRLSSGRVAFANTSAPRLPSALANITTAVIGLNDLAIAPVLPRMPVTGRRHHERSAATASGPVACNAAVNEAAATGGWTYPQLASAYSLTSLYNSGYLGGNGATIGLFELDPWSASDISSFQTCYGTNVPITSVNVDGGAGTGPGEGEAALDIETAIGLAPQVKLYVYDAPPSQAYSTSTVDEYTKIFDSDQVSIVSSSYGLCEQFIEGTTPGLLSSENTLFEQGATEGMSVFAASGDSGSEGCDRATGDTTDLAVLDQSAQPFVTSVGGTDLTALGPPPAEKVWNEGLSSGAGAGGGGISNTWAMPSWQSGPGVINSDSSGTPCGATSGYCREVPDVSASADPEHGYIIYWNGNWTPIGGTSAGTPLWAGILADIESEISPAPRMGFLNPVLYSTAAAGGSAFNDITSGNNDYTGANGGLYPATAHYDMASGLGSPIAPGLASAILAANSTIAFTDAPGTGSPPAHLGRYTVKKFKAASCSQGTYYSRRPTPVTGYLSFSPKSECEKVGSGWNTWSNGYTGDVYWDNANEGGNTTLTLTLPAGIQAFYFYAEPDEYETFDLEATAQNGTTSGPLQVYGESGADYYGFYAKGSGNFIQKIKISSNDDFAVGEFGIAK